MHTLAFTLTQAEAERSLLNLLDSTPTSSTSPPSLRLRQNSEGVQDATNVIDNAHSQSFELGKGKWTWKVEQTSKVRVAFTVLTFSDEVADLVSLLLDSTLQR